MLYDKLKPCPMCGGRARITSDDEYFGGEWCEAIHAECVNCGMRTRAYHSYTVEEKGELARHVAALWNRRTE